MLSKKYSLQFASITLLAAFISFHSLASYGAPPSLVNPESSVQQLFPSGVYTYNTWDSVTMRSHLRYISGLGFNTIHVDFINLTDRNDITVIDIAKDYNIHVIHQMNDVYFGWSGENAVNAASEIGSSLSKPNMLAYSVKEEPKPVEVPPLFNYYQSIKNSLGIQTIPFYLLHNDVNSITAVKNSYGNASALPPITGADRYQFFWHYCQANGYMTTPNLAFLLLMDSVNGIPPFLAQTDLTYQRYYSVITGNTQRESKTIQQLQNGAVCDNSATPTPTATAFYDRWIRLAHANNQGLRYVSAPAGDSVLSWTYYRPPQGAMSAQAWLSVAAGAQGILAWSADPDSALAHREDATVVSLLDEHGQPHRALGELAQVARDLKPFGWIINQMRRDPSSDTLVAVDLPIISDNTLANTSPPPISQIVKTSFTVPGLSAGHVVALVNTHVGSWVGNSTNSLYETENYRIDESGELIDFTPSNPIRINLSSSGNTIFDFSTGLPISDHNDGDTTPDIDLKAGAGKLLFVGTQNDFNALRAQAGITRTIGLAGLSLLTADQRATIDSRLIIPANPVLSSSTSYDFTSFPILLNHRYKLDTTVTTMDGAAFGVAIIGYDINWQQVNGETHQIGIWNVSASSPTSFTSDEFTITNPAVAHALAVFHRSNQQGSVKVMDAWLQSSEEESRLTTNATNITKTLQGNKFNIYIDAHSQPSQLSKLKVSYAAYNGSNPVSGGSGILIYSEVVPASTAATPNTRWIKSINVPTATSVKLTIENPNNPKTNALVIHKAWAEAVN